MGGWPSSALAERPSQGTEHTAAVVGSVNQLPAVVAKETGGESKLRSDEPFLLHRDNIRARWKYSGLAFHGNDGQVGE